MKRIRSTSKKPKRLISTSRKPKRIEPSQVASALGAEPDNSLSLERKGSPPITFFTLRMQLLDELVSSGGRPGRQGASTRHKIPLTEQEWDDLKLLADTMEKAGVKTSPAQVAGALIHRSLFHLRKNLNSEAVSRGGGGEDFLAAAAASGELGEDMLDVAEELRRKMRTGGGLEALLGLDDCSETSG